MERNFEPMSVGRILDQVFRIYKDNFIRFIAIIAVIQIPILLLSSFQQMLFLQLIKNSETGAALIALTTLPTVFLAMLGQTLSSGALTRSVAETYLGHDMSVGQVYKHVLPKLLTLILASLLVGLCVGIGFLFFVVPGVIFGLWFAMTTPAIIMEDLQVTTGMSRSRALAKGNLGKVLSVGFLVFLLAIVISIPFQFAGTWMTRTVAKENPTLSLLITQLAGTIGTLITMPIGAIASILLYYDLRIRKEGFDLQMMAESIHSPADNAQ
jgi:hypothetical protein